MVPSCYSRLQVLKKNINAFVTSELQNFQRILSPDTTEEPDDQRPEELTREDENNREAFLKITLSMLRKANEHELADHLQTRKTITTFHFVEFLPDDETMNPYI